MTGTTGKTNSTTNSPLAVVTLYRHHGILTRNGIQQTMCRKHLCSDSKHMVYLRREFNHRKVYGTVMVDLHYLSFTLALDIQAVHIVVRSLTHNTNTHI